MRSWISALSAVSLLVLPAAAASQPAPLDASAYGAVPAIDFVQLSPSGERLAYVTVVGTARRLLVVDLSGKTVLSEPVGETKVRDIVWAGDDRLLVTASETQGLDLSSYRYEFSHTVAINLATSKLTVIFANRPDIFSAVFGYYGAVQDGGRWYGYFAGVTLSKTRGFEASLNSDSYADLYRVDLDSGAAQKVDSASHKSRRWVIAPKGAIVAYSEYNQLNGEWRLHADKAAADPLLTVRAPFGRIDLAGAGRTPGTVLVDQDQPEEWSLADGTHVPLPVNGRIGRFLYDPSNGYLAGVALNPDPREQVFFDPALAARAAGAHGALGPSAAIVSWSRDYLRVVVLTEGGSDPGTYWLINGKEAKPFAYAHPGVPDANVGATQVIDYRAADGLEIHGILTLPPGRPAKGLPLIVMPHGGPEGHDSPGFDWWAQALAGRGYAVFQPNFRGSDGYGVEFRDAGLGEWGRKMQTDISDGLAELARQGIVDPQRACIVGASYGGYAALAGVTVQNGLYRCAVSVAGVSDLNQMLITETRQAGDARNALTRYWRTFMGAKSDGDPSLRSLSPAKLAAQADAPILLIHGADDTIVPIGQSQMMERALRDAGRPVEMVLLKGEDHWLSTGATRTAMLRATIAFVEKHNPPQ